MWVFDNNEYPQQMFLRRTVENYLSIIIKYFTVYMTRSRVQTEWGEDWSLNWKFGILQGNHLVMCRWIFKETTFHFRLGFKQKLNLAQADPKRGGLFSCPSHKSTHKTNSQNWFVQTQQLCIRRCFFFFCDITNLQVFYDITHSFLWYH